MKAKALVVAGIIDDIRRVFQVLTEQSKKAESATSLTSSQLWVIKILKETSPRKVSDLALRMYLHPATMVGLLDRLEAKGLVTRTRSEKDRRVVHIDLTDKGRELEIHSPEVVQTLLVHGLESLTAQKLALISEGLEQVVRILGVEGVPPHLILSLETNTPKRRKKDTAS